MAQNANGLRVLRTSKTQGSSAFDKHKAAEHCVKVLGFGGKIPSLNVILALSNWRDAVRVEDPGEKTKSEGNHAFAMAISPITAIRSLKLEDMIWEIAFKAADRSSSEN
jgi:hypothetical protein